MGAILFILGMLFTIGVGACFVIILRIAPAIVDADPDAPELDAKGDGGGEHTRQMLSTL